MNRQPYEVTVTMTPAEVAIRAWLKSNRETLRGRAPDEVAYLAVICGFDLDDVCATLSTFQDAMQSSHIDNRAAYAMWLFDKAIFDFAKCKKNLERVPELDLTHQWKELVANTVTGMEA